MNMDFAIYIFYIIINLIYSYITVGYYWDAIQLENGSFVVFSQSGLYTLDPTFQILNNYYKEEYMYDLGLNTEEIKQFTKEDESYILIKADLFVCILNSDGNLFRIYTDYYHNLEKWTYSLIPFNHLRDVFYYYIITSNNNKIRFTTNSYNSTNNTLESKDFYFNNTYGSMSSYITCQLMKYSNESVISCFFSISINNEAFINCTVFNPEKNFEVIQTSQLKIESIDSIIKSEVMTTDDRQKVLIVFYSYDQKSLFYAGYDIYINNFTYGYLNKNNTYIIENRNFHISYFKETEEFIVSYFYYNILNTQNYYSYSIYSFDKNFNYHFLGVLGDKLLGNSCCKINLSLDFDYTNIFSQFIFFSSVAQKYCLISNLNSPIISLIILAFSFNYTELFL